MHIFFHQAFVVTFDIERLRRRQRNYCWSPERRDVAKHERRTTMEARAEEEVGEARHLPRIGEPAPDFEAESTFGTIRLEDFRGSWLIFFSHPADFS
jgi:hypothetical protein